MLKKLFKKLFRNTETEEVNAVQVMQSENVSSLTTTQNSTTKVEPPKLNIFEFNVAGVTAMNEALRRSFSLL
jgi:hypothetical protein